MCPFSSQSPYSVYKLSCERCFSDSLLPVAVAFKLESWILILLNPYITCFQIKESVLLSILRAWHLFLYLFIISY